MAYAPLRTEVDDGAGNGRAGRPWGWVLRRLPDDTAQRSPGTSVESGVGDCNSVDLEEHERPVATLDNKDVDHDLETPLAFDGTKCSLDDSSDTDEEVDVQRLFSKIRGRLLPLFFAMVIMCYIDRTSLAFAAIQLNADLAFPPSVYGMGSGLFFLGYSLFQIPSNLLLRRFGGPVWLAGIIAAWGVVASAFSAISTASHFYVLRLLLGATEAGAFPGMWYMLTMFFPGDQITFPFAVVEAGISLSHVVAAPMAAACLSLDGVGGLAGWRWLFILEGLPTLVLATLMYRCLPRCPEAADFLTPIERRALLRRIANHNRSAHTPELGEEKLSGAGITTVSSVAGGLAAGAAAAGGPGSGIVKRSKARGGGGAHSFSYVGSHNTVGASETAAVPARVSGGSLSSCSAAGSSDGSSWHAVQLAVTNKYVWYLGALKFVRDIASFGLIFWAPTIVNSLLQEMQATRSPTAYLGSTVEGATPDAEDHIGRQLLGGLVPAEGHSSTGAAAVLLTALPFALAALSGMALAHSSQRTGEKILHVAIPYIVTGVALTLYAAAADRSPWLGFIALSLGVVGVYCGSGPCLSLLSELAAGPGLVVALPLYNSVGTMGGFFGPSLVGWLVQKAYQTGSAAQSGGSSAAVIHGGGFGLSAVVLGGALCLSGLMLLGLGLMLARAGKARETTSVRVVQLGGNGGSSTGPATA